jgi:type IV fimbrial biogenesis protein FimT
MPMYLSIRRGIERCAATQRGFTLVELLVTLAIAGVLATIAVPNMTKMFRAARLSAQTDALVSTLNLARLEAVKRRSDVSVCGASNPATATNCSGVAVAHWTSGWVIFGTEVIRRLDGKTGLTVNADSTEVVFTGTIGSASTTASFTLCVSGETQQQVDVGLSGHVSKRTNSGTTC